MRRPTPRDAVEIRCPNCGRFLASAVYWGRAPCVECGWEVIVLSPKARKEVFEEE